MTHNPYQPPQSLSKTSSTITTNRQAAQRKIRISTIIFLVPALYNLVCFSLLTSSQIVLPFFVVNFLLNLLGAIIVVAAVWFFGLTILEMIAAVAYRVVARKSERNSWYDTLYNSLTRLPLFAVLGSILWTMWVAGFYQLRLSFFVVSIPIGIAAHLLAAGLYIPLLYRWYRLEVS
jgi:hypothetical protein